MRDHPAWHALASGIFLDACRLPAGERDAFVRSACAGDDALLAEVLELLENDTGEAPHDDAPPAILEAPREVARRGRRER